MKYNLTLILIMSAFILTTAVGYCEETISPVQTENYLGETYEQLPPALRGGETSSDELEPLQNSEEIQPSSADYKEEPKLNDIKLDLRDYNGVIIPAGVVISVINMQEISTQTCPIGYKTKFVSTNDLYIDETKIIPEDSAFYGYIEKINEPIIGTNASMKIKITKLVLPDGFEVPIKGYIYTTNNNLIGGELTPPSEWVKMPHYQDKYQGIAWIHRGATLQIRPGGKRSMGQHTKVPTGERMLIELTAPAEITHTIED